MSIEENFMEDAINELCEELENEIDYDFYWETMKPTNMED